MGDLYMEGKYVLFGAGMTGMAVVNYFGKDNIVAVIDNAPDKIGTYFEGIEVISFDKYLETYAGLQIIISIYSKHYFSGIEQLQKNGIDDYFTAPPVLYGFASPEEMAECILQKETKQFIFDGKNPISSRMARYIERNSTEKVGIGFLENKNGNISIDNADSLCDTTCVSKDSLLVITTHPLESDIREKIKMNDNEKKVDIYDWGKTEEKYYHNELLRYKEIHAGECCFIIGNGPSLKKEDLEALKSNNIITFAANGIYHIYEETTWRPSYYVMCDAIAYKMMYKDIVAYADESYFIADYYYTNMEVMEGINRYHFINELQREAKFKFSTDITKGIYSGKTVVYAMIQLACYMGFKEIYLLGVDWTGGKNTGVMRKDFYNKDMPETNNYYYDLVYEEKVAFESAKEYAEQNGIKIYNATRGGELEVFERRDFDDILDRV